MAGVADVCCGGKSDPHGHLTPFLCLVLDVIRSKLQLSSLKAKRRAKAPDGPKNKVRFVATYPDPVGVAAAVDAIVDAPYTDAADVATPAAVDVLAEDANVASVVYADDVVNAVDTIAVDIADYFDAFDAFAATVHNARAADRRNRFACPLCNRRKNARATAILSSCRFSVDCIATLNDEVMKDENSGPLLLTIDCESATRIEHICHIRQLGRCQLKPLVL
ncbi:hypothetical protein B0O80DRAFT_530858 [Mortierella sp. GBAus27b]|nr:hypothetical protein B0O80DRAFT_530858 [Mortierella sp. GBAus27b]